MNNVNLIGRIATEIELRYTPDGTAVCDFVVAVDNYGDKTSFIDVTCWRKLAENVAEYMEKGRQVGITGEIVQDRWQDDNGNNRSKIKIQARNVKFLSGGQSGNQQSNDSQQESVEVPF